MSQQPNFEKESIGKLLLKLSIPSIVAQLVNALYNIVDRIYIGHMPEVGDVALTGVGLTFPIIMLVAAFSALISVGGASIASIRMGAKDKDGADKILSACFTMLILAGAILSVVLFIFSEKILYLFGASADTIIYAKPYLDIYAFGTIAVMLSLGLNLFITAQGFANVSMATVAIGAVVNIILDPIFIFVLDMGTAGAALATVISQMVSAIWVLWFTFGKKPTIRVRKKYLIPSSKIVFAVIPLGLAPFIMQSTESLLQITFNKSLGFYGNDLYIGSMTIINSVSQFILLPITGITSGAQPIIGYNYGAQKIDRVRTATKYTIFSCLTFSTVMWAIVMLFPRGVAGFFSNSTELIDLTVRTMRVYMLGIFALGAQIACQQSFIALGKAKISICLALLRKVVLLIPLILIFPRIFSNSVMGVFAAEPIADILAMLTTVAVFMWQLKRLDISKVK